MPLVLEDVCVGVGVGVVGSARIPMRSEIGLVEWRSGLGSITSQRDKPPWPTHPTKQANPSLGSGSGTNGSNQHELVTQLCRPVGYLYTHRTIQHAQVQIQLL